ncbi:MAG TPA: hypothetical protein VFE41_14595 [Acetobacteraceae bacterium]|nr:hypothetical protein [Acetobacteraceae bacterium]
MAGAVKYCAQPFIWPSPAAAVSPVVGTAELLTDHAKAAPITAVGAATAIICTPPFGATFTL